MTIHGAEEQSSALFQAPLSLAARDHEHSTSRALRLLASEHAGTAPLHRVPHAPHLGNLTTGRQQPPGVDDGPSS